MAAGAAAVVTPPPSAPWPHSVPSLMGQAAVRVAPVALHPVPQLGTRVPAAVGGRGAAADVEDVADEAVGFDAGCIGAADHLVLRVGSDFTVLVRDNEVCRLPPR